MFFKKYLTERFLFLFSFVFFLLSAKKNGKGERKRSERNPLWESERKNNTTKPKKKQANTAQKKNIQKRPRNRKRYTQPTVTQPYKLVSIPQGRKQMYRGRNVIYSHAYINKSLEKRGDIEKKSIANESHEHRTNREMGQTSTRKE